MTVSDLVPSSNRPIIYTIILIVIVIYNLLHDTTDNLMWIIIISKNLTSH